MLTLSCPYPPNVIDLDVSPAYIDAAIDELQLGCGFTMFCDKRVPPDRASVAFRVVSAWVIYSTLDAWANGIQDLVLTT